MTAKPCILVTRKLPDDVMARLSAGYNVIENENDETLSSDEIISRASSADAILCGPTDLFNKEVLDQLPDRLKMITTFSVGYDHIDVPAAFKNGIQLGNTPDVLTDATADITLLCLLGAARMAHSSAMALREGRWQKWATTQFLGIHVSGKRLGILGMGRIGQAVARRARGFDMEIHYHNRNPVTDARGLEDAIYHDSLESLLGQSDFFSINCGLSDQTFHLINNETIDLLPKGAVIVNTARGPIIDDIALINALKSGRIAAAGLDVFENEPTLNPGYLALENLFVLPHIGSATIETRNAMGFKCIDNLDAFFSNKPIPNPITL
ncbi:2-hydroxyacid dehydrogenase [Sneathiella aquimaris]|uniref:2-hydroxyacid dehydrogenase n=1 Tax=Sneathiella aquimaris TaxID=2599305 RepID=UPI00146D617E|nr:D-glycerate dehydrogenase [Sneathiella aquimaris]